MLFRSGIRELDNPLPKWWVWVFLATIVWALGYWVAMPAWPLVEGYTQGLLGAIPRAGTGRGQLKVIPGQVPSLMEPIVGCRFADRCIERERSGLTACTRRHPDLLQQRQEGVYVRCFLHEGEVRE